MAAAWLSDTATVKNRPGSFSWSEDLDETLNYWFWLRRKASRTAH
jgi:hypothetical protein